MRVTLHPCETKSQQAASLKRLKNMTNSINITLLLMSCLLLGMLWVHRKVARSLLWQVMSGGLLFLWLGL